jgi:hypothetical protein
VAGVYNKAQYASQKRVALERWAQVLAEIVGTSANPPPPQLEPIPDYAREAAAALACVSPELLQRALEAGQAEDP